MRQPPWLSIAAAHQAAPYLDLATGVAVAFPRSPMVTAQTAWELAEATAVGSGSASAARCAPTSSGATARVRPAGRPAARLRARRAGVLGGVPRRRAAGVRRALLPDEPAAGGRPAPPPRARGPPARHRRRRRVMVRAAGEVADGIHVHPLHSVAVPAQQLAPALAEGTAGAGRSVADVDLMIPVSAAPGDTPEERAPLPPALPRASWPSTDRPATTPSSSTTSGSRARRPGSTNG